LVLKMAAQPTLIFSFYAPALTSDDNRPLAAVHEMERVLPGLRLEWTISGEGRMLLLPQRDAWVAQETAGGEFPLLCNGDESNLVTFSGWERPARLSPGGERLFQVHAELPLDAVGLLAAADVLEAVAEGARAFWGRARQTSPAQDGPPHPPRGLPALKLFEDIRAPEIPYFLGWLNYWSAAAARAIGFPDSRRDADLLSRARHTATGSWVVRLTDAPLDLDNPVHLDALLRAYERFPQIGGRATS
jgi:hypothetical protein